jgi:hypothetical protein
MYLHVEFQRICWLYSAERKTFTRKWYDTNALVPKASHILMLISVNGTPLPRLGPPVVYSRLLLALHTLWSYSNCPNGFLDHGQCSKWKFRSAGIILKSESRIHRQKNGYSRAYILISAGMKFRKKKKFRYGIPAYTELCSLYCTVLL